MYKKACKWHEKICFLSSFIDSSVEDFTTLCRSFPVFSGFLPFGYFSDTYCICFLILFKHISSCHSHHVLERKVLFSLLQQFWRQLSFSFLHAGTILPWILYSVHDLIFHLLSLRSKSATDPSFHATMRSQWFLNCAVPTGLCSISFYFSPVCYCHFDFCLVSQCMLKSLSSSCHLWA